MKKVIRVYVHPNDGGFYEVEIGGVVDEFDTLASAKAHAADLYQDYRNHPGGVEIVFI